MAIWPFNREQRASIEDPSVSPTVENFIQFFGTDIFGESASGEPVNVDTALGVPAAWAAINFLSGTLAGLPLHHYRKTKGGRERVNGKLAGILHDAVNDETSSFDWRKYSFDQTFSGGRSFTFIERNAAGAVMNLWPLDPKGVTVKRVKARKQYVYKDGGKTHTYAASEIIDIPFMLKSDGISHRSPLLTARNVVGLAIAATKYGSKFFQNGGVPPFAIEGPFQSPGALQRAAADLEETVKKSAKENRLALALPSGHTIKQLGVDPEKSQLEELQRFLVEQIARIYSLPPVFLQDLTHGTYSNTEQQDLHLVKHTLRRWIEQTEQELNLKLFGRGNRTQYIEFNVDGLLRGDFKTRMEGYAKGIQNAIYTPNEVRRRENLPDDPQGELLLIQGATVPLGQQPNTGDNDDDS